MSFSAHFKAATKSTDKFDAVSPFDSNIPVIDHFQFRKIQKVFFLLINFFDELWKI